MTRIIVALGGNALLKRGEEMTAANQRRNARIAAEALAPLCAEHEVVITHGDRPRAWLLALHLDCSRAACLPPLARTQVSRSRWNAA